MLPVIWKLFAKAGWIHQSVQKTGLNGDSDSKIKCPFTNSAPRKPHSPCKHIRREDSSTASIVSIPSISWFFFGEVAKPEISKLIQSILDLNRAASVVTSKDIIEADQLFNNYTGEEDYKRILYLLLKHWELNLPEIVWRLARLYYKKSENETNRNVKSLMLRESITISNMAIKMAPHCSQAYIWKAISLYNLGKMHGLIEFTKQLEVVKELLKRAKELNADDPLAHHLYGMLCINVVELPWIVKVFIEGLYGPLPKCTHEEALESFLMEEKKRTKPSCTNYYMLIKLFIHFKNYLEARDYLVKLEELHVESEQDSSAKEMSEKFLSVVVEEVKIQLEELSLYWHPPGPTKEELEEILEAAKNNQSFIPRLVHAIDVLDRFFSQDEDSKEKFIPDWEEDPLAWSKLRIAIQENLKETEEKIPSSTDPEQ